jgi:transcriptional regulator with XRE-family HTH domain
MNPHDDYTGALERKRRIIFLPRLRTLVRQAQAGPDGKKIRLREIAEQCGMKPSVFYMVHRGDHPPSIGAIVRLSEGLDTTPNYLLGFDPPEPEPITIPDDE